MSRLLSLSAVGLLACTGDVGTVPIAGGTATQRETVREALLDDQALTSTPLPIRRVDLVDEVSEEVEADGLFRARGSSGRMFLDERLVGGELARVTRHEATHALDLALGFPSQDVLGDLAEDHWLAESISRPEDVAEELFAYAAQEGPVDLEALSAWSRGCGRDDEEHLATWSRETAFDLHVVGEAPGALGALAQEQGEVSLPAGVEAEGLVFFVDDTRLFVSTAEPGDPPAGLLVDLDGGTVETADHAARGPGSASWPTFPPDEATDSALVPRQGVPLPDGTTLAFVVSEADLFPAIGGLRRMAPDGAERLVDDVCGGTRVAWFGPGGAQRVAVVEPTRVRWWVF